MGLLFIFVSICATSDVARSLARLQELTVAWKADDELLTVVDKLLQTAGGVRVPLAPKLRRLLESPSFPVGAISYDERHTCERDEAKAETSWNFSASHLVALNADKSGRLPFLAVHDGKVSFLGTKEEYDPVDLKADHFAADQMGSNIQLVGTVGSSVEVIDVMAKEGLNVTRSRFDLPEVDEITTLAYSRPTLVIGDATGHVLCADIKVPSAPQFSSRVKVENSPILQLHPKNSKEIYVLTKTSFGVFNAIKEDFASRPCRIPPSDSFAVDGDNNVYISTVDGPIAQISLSKCRAVVLLPSLHMHAPTLIAVKGHANMMVVASAVEAFVFVNRKPIMVLDIPGVTMARVRFTKSVPTLSLTTKNPLTRFEVGLPLERFSEDSMDGIIGWIIYVLDVVPRPVILGVIFVVVLLYNIRKVQKKRESEEQ